MAGFIYILEHGSGTTVKVGETRVSPERRAADYSREHKLNDFKLAKVFEVPEEARKDIESRAHQKLRKYKLSGASNAREIFSCSLSDAVYAVESAISSSEQFKHWQETEGQRKAQEKAIGVADKERDDSLRKLEEEASNWSNKRTVQRSKEKEILLEDYNRKKYFFLLGGIFLAGWAFTAPAGGPFIGLMAAAGLLWWFFKWSRKIIDGAEKVLDQKFPIRELSDYPAFSVKQRNINSNHETRIREIKASFSVKKHSEQSSRPPSKINTAERQLKAEIIAPQTPIQTKESSDKDITNHGVSSDKKSAGEKKAAFDSEQKELRQSQSRRLAREEAERKAEEEAERQARAEAKRLAIEEAKRLAREEAERQAKEEAERQAKEEAKRLAREEAKRKSFLKGEIARFGGPAHVEKKVGPATNEDLRPKANRAARRKKIRNQTKIDDCEQLIERLSRAAINGHYSAEFLHLEKILHQTSEIKSSCANCSGVHNHYYNIGGKSLRCGLCGHERVF